MNELTTQFSKYLCEAAPAWRLLIGRNGFRVEHAFAIALFSESKKRRMNAGTNDLVLDAVATLIGEHREDFNAWRSTHVVGFCHRFTERDFEIMTRELASHVESSDMVKRISVQWFRDARSELFESDGFRIFLGEFVVEEHPMHTFVFWLDYIEGMKGLADYSRWLTLKRNLTNLLRVGNAVLKRSDWQSVAVSIKG